jgi:formylglycine-generating enzyme required for sulfatase activity
MPHIFISYAKKDTRALAENLYHALNAAPGLTVWMDRSLEADESWAQQIMDEIDRCDYMVVLLSPDVNRPATATQARSFVLNEIDYAQQDRKPILPVMVIKTRQPVQIAGIQFIDLTQTPADPAPIIARVYQRFEAVLPTQALPNLPAKLPRRGLWIGAVLLTVLALVMVGVLLSGLLNPVPTLTPVPLPTGFAAITRNADWTPIAQDFDGVTMLLVPVGCFDMGSEEGMDEQPIHQHCFEQPFWIDRTEVTQGNFARQGGQKAMSNGFEGENRPVEAITWFEARDFCALRGMRLPTEPEWEYAARGPDNLTYPWGNDWNPDAAVWGANANEQTAPVGSRTAGASWVGALDMSGNVWEWVSTIYGIDDGDFNFSEAGERRYDYPYDPTDGREQAGEAQTLIRALRGSSWDNPDADTFRAPYRGGNPPTSQVYEFGFRCARDYDNP